MKTLGALICIGASLSGALGQGTINFFNTSSSLVSVGAYNGALMSGIPGSYYFALLTSPVGLGNFTFAGVYATNQAVAGRFNGGVSVAVPGWAPGTARDFQVAGWSANMGPGFNPRWLGGDIPFFGFFGLSNIGTGVPGGTTSTGTLPPLNIFGGSFGIQGGFSLISPLIPEASSLSIAALGAAALLIFRRKGPNKPLHRTGADCSCSGLAGLSGADFKFGDPFPAPVGDWRRSAATPL